MKCDWDHITSLAYLTLIELGLCEFPMQVTKIKCEGIVISSYQNYAKITRLSIEEITLGHELEDAFVLRNVRPGINVILYDDEQYEARLKHSLWHEIGHVKCNHQRQGDKEEIEAHFFAAQANAPNALIKTISQRGYVIDVTLLMECFGLSKEAAKKKKDYLSKYGFDHVNEYDDVINLLFLDYINKKFPPKTQYFHDDYYDELEKERENWN